MAATSTNDHFRDYPRGNRDEAFGPRGGVAEPYRAVIEAINRCNATELRARQRRLDRAAAELGIQFALPGERRQGGIDWHLDLFPRVLSAADWDLISRGVIQRAQAFNAYIADLYGEQEILAKKVIPFEPALSDPAFHRVFSGIKVPGNRHCLVGAFDLIRQPDGEWQVLEHQMALPVGISYILQNRRLLSQAFPELFESVDVEPVATFSTFLAENLRAQCDRDYPHVVLLTRDKSEENFFEEGFLARHMGISMAKPGDLLVRDSKVFLKTIRGLERVDIIYRRVDSASMDPIATPGSGYGGIPGLVNVARLGNVAVVNALGAGVADNRAILRYADRIVGHYTGQRPLLATAPTYHLSDHDQRAYVFDHKADMVFKPIQEHENLLSRLGWKGKLETAAELERFARHHPDFCVAQPTIFPSRLPRFQQGRFTPHTVFTRVFFILGERPVVLPGGLTRQTFAGHRSARLAISAEGMKDTWVPGFTSPGRRSRTAGIEAGERISIGSRTAEALYWAGRYIERAENTARQFNILETLRWDQLGRITQKAYWPLLQAVAAATGKTKIARRKHPPRDTLKFSTSLVLDPAEGASVHACVNLAQQNLRAIRDTVSPECWQSLRELAIYLGEQSRERVSRRRLREVSDMVVREIARFNGVAERSMLHDDAWQFFRIGIFLERALGGLYLLSIALPRSAETYESNDEESTDLTALLRLTGSLDAYRREYRSRAYLDRVARLLLLSPNNPSSVSFSLRHIRYSLGTLSITGERRIDQNVLDEVQVALEQLNALPLDKMFSSPVADLDAGAPAREVRGRPDAVRKPLENLARQVEGLHDTIEDFFFSHQHVFAHEPTLFEMD